jgi:hypothetical protein
MAKLTSTTLMFRLSSALKHRIESAAYHSGHASLQTFLLQAAMAATEVVERRTAAQPLGRSAAATRRARDVDQVLLLCRKARAGGPGFACVGRGFARKLHRLILSLAQPTRERRRLGEHFRHLHGARCPNYGPLLTWCDTHFPRLMNEVSRRRRREFAVGFWDAVWGGEARFDFRKW